MRVWTQDLWCSGVSGSTTEPLGSVDCGVATPRLKRACSEASCGFSVGLGFGGFNLRKILWIEKFLDKCLCFFFSFLNITNQRLAYTINPFHTSVPSGTSPSGKNVYSLTSWQAVFGGYCWSCTETT